MEPTTKLLCPECKIVNEAENDVAQECANCRYNLTHREHQYNGDGLPGDMLTET